MVCTYVTFQSRNAIREVGKVLGLPAHCSTGWRSRSPRTAPATRRGPYGGPEFGGLPRNGGMGSFSVTSVADSRLPQPPLDSRGRHDRYVRAHLGNSTPGAGEGGRAGRLPVGQGRGRRCGAHQGGPPRPPDALHDRRGIDAGDRGAPGRRVEPRRGYPPTTPRYIVHRRRRYDRGIPGGEQGPDADPPGSGRAPSKSWPRRWPLSGRVRSRATWSTPTYGEGRASNPSRITIPAFRPSSARPSGLSSSRNRSSRWPWRYPVSPQGRRTSLRKAMGRKNASGRARSGGPFHRRGRREGGR